MKLNPLCLFALTYAFLFGCTQPITNSLLVNPSKACDSSTFDCPGDTAAGDFGIPELSDFVTARSMPIEESDMIEITGACKDLGRINNRILVEVYAAEDESAKPYIDNTITDACYPTTNPVRSGLESVFINPKAVVMGISQGFTFAASGGTPPYSYSIVFGGGSINAGSGLFTSAGASGTTMVQVTDAALETSRSVVTVLAGITNSVASPETKKCFAVTKGTGLVEDLGLPNERTFPQCHNGQFGFSVRLGKLLLNPSVGQPNYKYLVRFKLRTQDGTIADSTWSKVTVERTLSTPLIASAKNVAASQKCTIKNSPARFNPGILYDLNRTYTDILATNAGNVNLFTASNTLVNTVGTSVFEWDDVGLVDGVTYNYTLTSTEAGNAYSPTTPTANSTVVSCRTKKIYVAITGIPSANTCYLGLSSDLSADADGDQRSTSYNPYVTYEWGYSATNANWIGADGKTNSGFVSATCGNTAVCTEGGLTTATNYFFALRAKNLVTGEIGRWSPTITCRTN